MVDRETGETLAVEYMLCDPALADDAAQVARWMHWANAADEQFRTLRHAVEHFAQEGDAAEGQGISMVSLQLGLTTLRLQHTTTATAPAFLSRLAGRTAARASGPVPGTVLNEGMGRLLALLDVLENYPGRPAAAATITDSAPEAAMQAMAGMPQLAVAGE
jgi:flagellar biosynthesis protein FlhF